MKITIKVGEREYEAEIDKEYINKEVILQAFDNFILSLTADKIIK